MRRMENFIKIVVLTVMMTAVLLVADLLVLTCFGVWTDAGLSRVSMTGLAEQTSRMCDERGALQYSMSQQGMAKLDALMGLPLSWMTRGMWCGVIGCRPSFPCIIR